MHGSLHKPLEIAVVGSGIAGLSAAWLLSQAHDVTLYEVAPRLGGHANTVDVRQTGGASVPVDTGFIVYNEATYPNFKALMAHLGVATKATEMSFAVSLDQGRLEYSGTSLSGLFAQRRNLLSPRFWSMLGDLRRFYAQATQDALTQSAEHQSLGDYLDAGRYGVPFREDHLLPMAAAIWSAPCSEILSYPAAAFIRFHHNHGLLKLTHRPVWRTIVGGSRSYVEKLRAAFSGTVATRTAVRSLARTADGVALETAEGERRTFDHVVIAAHADQALAMLSDPSADEKALLGAFRYSRNRAVLHSDETLMPRRRSAWASWNHLGDRTTPDAPCAVTYWMNRLQGLETEKPLFVTLNPPRDLAPGSVLRDEMYEHPIFDGPVLAAQARLWSLQGGRNTWFCGAHFGSGFHEDGLQAGLAVAEDLGGVRRPWNVAEESGRIVRTPLVTALDHAA
ncbi:MAG: NAD(P)/FAD-dependent oxidoreductase [Bosea sp. (in: a-proteobacteria)]|uniref:NAD(P)/FAD-dependent oxidoreductase n=1 Tax=Bosea sp. (in: a-proteobacteria) TaxID=1871050 RepID=UPI0027328016|nr:NAD(P)/FAD-dependent oxidoreductase [Bosea sp. (in: a-proteobacteria)]MDP3257797.1 NAD(P)/FAD-dependent oxidoreductase [Bosea sp. (in: a-proteobacteria)]MDP3318739.1 NAD(P)/FAD-dependent oxidoreductase [Bosea sp. (in: a-proteobacteria)]